MSKDKPESPIAINSRGLLRSGMPNIEMTSIAIDNRPSARGMLSTAAFGSLRPGYSLIDINVE